MTSSAFIRVWLTDEEQTALARLLSAAPQDAVLTGLAQRLQRRPGSQRQKVFMTPALLAQLAAAKRTHGGLQALARSLGVAPATLYNYARRAGVRDRAPPRFALTPSIIRELEAAIVSGGGFAEIARKYRVSSPTVRARARAIGITAGAVQGHNRGALRDGLVDIPQT